MRYHLRSALLGTAFLVFAVGASRADVSEADRTFIDKAAMGGHEEVSSGQTAAKSANPSSAAFGKQKVTDHTKMNDELATIAESKGVKPPTSASMMDQAKGAV